MSRRTWLYTALVGAVGADSVFAGGALTSSPELRPFVVYRLQGTAPRLKDGGAAVRTSVTAEVWVYDNPGSYDLIDTVIRNIRTAIVGPIAEPGLVSCEWSGDSSELADDEMKAILRFSTYQLIGADV